MTRVSTFVCPKWRPQTASEGYHSDEHTHTHTHTHRVELGEGGGERERELYEESSEQCIESNTDGYLLFKQSTPLMQNQ